MKVREPYKGYVLEAAPVPDASADRWVAKVVIELHDGDDVHFQEVAGDPSVTYASEVEAARASLDLGRTLLDSAASPAR